MYKSVLIISDLHISLVNVEKHEKLIRRLYELLPFYDKIILNGDTLEGWKYGEMGWDIDTRKSKLEEILDLYPLMRSFMMDPKVIVLVGNHDYALINFQNEPWDKKKYIVKTILGDVLVTHGNDCSFNTSYKYISSKDSLWVMFTAWAASKFNQVINFFTKKSIAKLEKEQNEFYTAYSDENNDMLKYVNDLSKDNEYRAIITGHTHESLMKKLDNGTMYYNCGRVSVDKIEGIHISNMGIISHINIPF